MNSNRKKILKVIFCSSILYKSYCHIQGLTIIPPEGEKNTKVVMEEKNQPFP